MPLWALALGLSAPEFRSDHEGNAQVWQTLNNQAMEPYQPPLKMRRAMDRNWTQIMPVAAVTTLKSTKLIGSEDTDAHDMTQEDFHIFDATSGTAEAALPKDVRDLDISSTQVRDVEVTQEDQAKMKVSRFVILSQARSGSTWLSTMLSSHPNVLTFGEYLSSWAGHNVDGDGLVCKPQQRLERLDNVNNWKECPGLTPGWTYADKRRWIEAAKTEPVSAGFTWFNNHGGWDIDWARHQKNCPTDGCQTCKDPSDFSSWIRHNNVKLILIERAASLPHFISEMKQHEYEKQKCTNQECTDRVAREKIKVDIAQMHRWFNFTTEYWNNMKSFARRSSNERQFFTYDELCEKPQEIVDDLFRFLNLQPQQVNTSQAHQKGVARMRDNIVNADEVAEMLKGTVFEGQVDEEFSSWRAAGSA